MCGIAGFWSRSPSEPSQATAIGRRMADALVHRGPDAGDVWSDGHITLAHRRLAVVELSSAGAQPMRSRSGRWVISYNGEIYNHDVLRAELEQQSPTPMRGHSDTEVLVEALDRWGIAATLERIEGMYAFAAWDREQRALVLAVDRFGEKPLYYGWAGDCLLFGSELASLEHHPAFRGNVSRSGVASLMQLGYVPAPRTIFEDVWKCPPGSFVVLTSTELETRQLPPAVAYWDALAVAHACARVADGRTEGRGTDGRGTDERGTDNGAKGLSEDEHIDRLVDVLSRSVRRQLQADVPVGAFLSGGIDSTTIVAVAQSVSPKPVRTYTVGFEGGSGSESEAARAVAAHLGTEHHDVHFSERDLLDLVPRMAEVYSEPFADVSMLPTQLVSRAARADVTVALSGDGGDELFGGYDRYLSFGSLRGLLERYPRWLRRTLAAGLLRVPARRLDSAYASFGQLSGRAATYRDVGDKVHKLARGLDAADPKELYRRLVSRWPVDSGLVLGRDGAAGGASAWPPANRLSPEVAWMMGEDTVGYLPGDILTKVDRAAMSVSLETRVPFLDREVFRCAWSLPPSLKIDGRQSKVALRRVLDRYVPRALIERPKTGFGVPIDDWLRGPLRDWASDLLAPDRLRRQGLLDDRMVSACWQRHLSGRQNLQQHLWPILVLQQWLDRRT